MSVAEFITRLASSRLLTASQLEKLRGDMELCSLPPKQLATELCHRKIITPYQARTLLAQRAPVFDCGPYRIVEQCSSGFRAGMFEAVHRPTGKRVELDVAKAPNSIEVVRGGCSVRHDNLARCFEVIDANGRSMVVSEFVSGQCLAGVIKQRSLSQKAACRVVQQLASACWALHGAGMTHNQLSIESVMVTSLSDVTLLRRPGRRVLKSTDAEESSDKVNELLRRLLASTSSGEATSHASDVYALGKILDQLTQSSERIDSLSELIDRLTAADPKQRLGHAGAVASALIEFVGEETGHEPDRAVSLGAIDQKYEEYLASNPATTSGPHAASVPIVDSSSDNDESASANAMGLAVNVGDEVSGAVSFSTEQSSQTDRIRERRRAARRTQIFVGTAVSVLLIAGGAWILKGRGADTTPSTNTSNGDSVVVAKDSDASLGSVSTGRTNSVDASSQEASSQNAGGRAALSAAGVGGTALWESPTVGGPFELRYVPQGARMYLHIRPSAILADEHGNRSVTSLGPEFQVSIREWEQRFGLRLEDVDALTVAIVPRVANRPEICWLIKTVSGLMPEKWSNGRRVDESGQIVYVFDQLAVWQPPDGPYVVGTEATVRGIVSMDSKAPVLRRELEQLRSSSDGERMLSVLFAPRFFSNEGDKLVAPQAYAVLDKLVEKLGDETRGCLASFHLNTNQFYGEMQLVSTTQRGPNNHANELRQAIAKTPDGMEAAIENLSALDAYWRRLAIRAVRMMEFFVQYTRTGVEGRNVVANVSLPPEAAHNLLLAVELTTASSGSATIRVEDEKQSLTFDEVLASKMSLDIPQQSIEVALRDLAALVNSEIGDKAKELVIRMDGPSLEEEGITRNQQIRGFQRNNATVADLLTGLVMVANPVTTVESAHEADQKLIWVVRPASEDGRVILITTRKSAVKNGYSLPYAFQAK